MFDAPMNGQLRAAAAFEASAARAGRRRIVADGAACRQGLYAGGER
jgi:hypothetical protein